jgi:hypothetical protein
MSQDLNQSGAPSDAQADVNEVVREQLKGKLSDDASQYAEAEVEEHTLEALELNPKTVVIEFSEDGVEYAIELRKAKRSDNEQRNRETVTHKFTKKVENKPAVTVTNSADKATIAFAKRLATRVRGYAEDENEWLDAQTVLGQEENDKGKLVDVRVIDKVPVEHVLRAGNEYFGGKFKVEKRGRVIITRGASQSYVVKQEVGIEELEDGSFSKPTSVVKYHFDEVSGDALQLYSAQAVMGTTIFGDEGDTREDRVVSLDTVRTLFDGKETLNFKGCVRIENATLNGSEVDCDDASHLMFIDDGLKKTVVLVLFNHLTTNLGNASKRSKRSR